MFKKNRLKYANTRLWKSIDNFIFPEQDPSHPDALGSKAKIGVCFSGGGTRSASATHGQIRALHSLGLIDKIGYFSCVSGGAWAALPYTYLPDHWEDSHFLGARLDPEELSPEVLKNIGQKNYLHTVTHAGIVDDLFKNWALFSGDETYSRAIGSIFLKHFDLSSNKKLFAYTDNHLKDILSRNSDMLPTDFYTVRKGRPFLIAGGALLRPGTKDISFEMTPWYTGVLKLHKGVGSSKRNIGGGFIESFANDSDSPDEEIDATAEVRIGSVKHRFTLSDVLGTTGAAPSEVLNNMGIDFFGFPEFKHWSVHGEVHEAKAKEYEIGDGGNLENLGIMPLLTRNVEKIVVFVNTKKELTESNPTQINSAVKALFTLGHVNHVFEASKLGALQSALMNKVADRQATIHKANYVLMDNEHHGVKGGREVEIIWVYNNIYKKWKDKLPTETQSMLNKKRFSNFPHFATFGENLPKVIDLHAEQASLLSHMSCSVVMDNADLFRSLIASDL